MARVLLLGNSILAGIGSTTIDPTWRDPCANGLRYGYRKLLADATPQHQYVGPCGRAPYQHAGVGGSTTHDWTADGAYGGKKLENWIASTSPTWIHLTVGTNDAISGAEDPSIPASRVASILGALARKRPNVTHTAGTIPRFRGSPTSALNRYVDAFNVALHESIADLDLANVHLIDAVASYDAALAAGEDVTVDGTHPNDRGYALLARDLAPAFGGTIATSDTKVEPPPATGLVGPMKWEIGPRLEVITRERGGAGDPEVLVFAPKDADAFFSNVVRPWGAAIAAACARHGIPWATPYALAIENAEAGGNPRALRHEPPSDRYPNGLTGVGLFQLTDPSIKKGYTDEQLFDPDLNIDLGVQAIAYQVKRYGKDLPRLASAYNCGSATASPGSLWGLCAYQQAYITRVVLAANTMILRGAGVPTSRKDDGNTLVAAAVAAVGVAAFVVVPWRKILSRG